MKSALFLSALLALAVTAQADERIEIKSMKVTKMPGPVTVEWVEPLIYRRPYKTEPYGMMAYMMEESQDYELVGYSDGSVKWRRKQ